MNKSVWILIAVSAAAGLYLIHTVRSKLQSMSPTSLALGTAAGILAPTVTAINAVENAAGNVASYVRMGIEGIESSGIVGDDYHAADDDNPGTFVGEFGSGDY